MKRLKGCLSIVLGILIVYMFINTGKKPNQDALPTLAVLPSLTWTAEAVAVQVTEPPGVTIIPTVIINRGFVTITPAPGTVYPTPTITDTPIPTTTNTDIPSATPAPQSTATPLVRALDPSTYYAIRTVNIRSCPNSTCNKLGQVASGTNLTVTGSAIGEEVTPGNGTWYQLIYGGTIGFAYGAYLTNVSPVLIQLPQNVPQQQIAPVTAAPSGAIICSDGYVWPGTTRQGACHGHGGIKK